MVSLGGAPTKYWVGMSKDEFLRVCSARYSQAILRTAVRLKVIVQQPCAVCGAQRAVGHHYDYSQPLDVIWLCQRHHVEEHRRLGVGTARIATGAIGISDALRVILHGVRATVQ